MVLLRSWSRGSVVESNSSTMAGSSTAACCSVATWECGISGGLSFVGGCKMIIKQL